MFLGDFIAETKLLKNYVCEIGFNAAEPDIFTIETTQSFIIGILCNWEYLNGHRHMKYQTVAPSPEAQMQKLHYKIDRAYLFFSVWIIEAETK